MVVLSVTQLGGSVNGPLSRDKWKWCFTETSRARLWRAVEPQVMTVPAPEQQKAEEASALQSDSRLHGDVSLLRLDVADLLCFQT